MKKIIALAAILAASGCAHIAAPDSPYAINRLPPAELKKVDDWGVIYAYAYRQTPKVEAELESRGIINDNNRQAIKDKTIYVGMGDGSLTLALGLPVKRNTSGGQNGQFDQWVYTGNRYVYLRNQKVTSWSGW